MTIVKSLHAQSKLHTLRVLHACFICYEYLIALYLWMDQHERLFQLFVFLCFGNGSTHKSVDLFLPNCYFYLFFRKSVNVISFMTFLCYRHFAVVDGAGIHLYSYEVIYYN